MNAYDSLDEILVPDYNSNSWSDDVINRCIDLVNELKAEHWVRLAAEFPIKPEGWQVRLADCLGDAPPEKAFPILRRMLHSPFEKVALQSGSSIYSLMQSGHPGNLSSEDIEVLKSLSQKHRLHGMILANVIQKFDPGYGLKP